MTLVLKVGSLIDGLGGTPIVDAVVVVDDGVITACGPRGEVPVPAGAEVLEAPGRTLMPGMIDCHVHMMSHSLRLEDRLTTHPTVALFMAAKHLELTLRAGFTTVRDAGGADPGLRHALERGLIPGPRLLVAAAVGQTGTHLESYFPTGVKLNVGGTTATRICDGPDQARRVVREAMREGFDLIKICTTGGALSPQDSPYFTELTLEEIKAIVETAASYGRTVMAHAQGTQGIKNAIRAGVWSVEHGSVQDDEATRMFVDTGTYLVPTLRVAHWVLDHGREAGVPEASLQKGADLNSFHFDSIRRAARAGVKLAVGTDALGAMHGGNAKELELLVTEAGLTPMEAIVAATRTGAEVCRVADRVGTIEAGKRADLLLVDGDPLEDILVLQNKARLTVFQDGRLVV